MNLDMSKLRDHLIAPLDYLAPDKVLDGISDSDANRRLPGANHSIAEIVAHLAFWQDWFHARCMGNPAPVVASAAAGWPTPAAPWMEAKSRFLNRLEQLATLAEGDLAKPVTPPIDFAPLADATVADVLVHVATHNAHHLGQVIVLRQLMGLWPPPAGSYTW